MQLLVVGRGAAEVGQAAVDARPDAVATVVETAAAATPHLADGAALVMDGAVRGAVGLARTMLAGGGTVLLAEVPTAATATWATLAARTPARLSLCRPLRFDRLLATARQAVRDDTVGLPRTVHLVWSFAGLPSRAGAARRAAAVRQAALHLLDAGLWLLGAEPATLYALPSEADGVPMLMANVQTTDGALLLLHLTLGTEGYPPLRELSLLASDGALYHRTSQDDILWSASGSTTLGHADDGLVSQMAAWLATEAPARVDLADGAALRQAFALAAALDAALASGEPVTVGTPT